MQGFLKSCIILLNIDCELDHECLKLILIIRDNGYFRL